MRINEAMRGCSNSVVICEVNEYSLNKTIQISQEAFFSSECSRSMSWFEFLYQQMFYVKKRWWILQACTLVFLWIIFRVAGTGQYVERCMGIVASLFIVLFLPELWKNVNYQSIEIEGTALFSLQKVVAARLILFGMVDIILLSMFIVFGVAFTDVTVMEMLINFVLPMEVTTCICLRLFSAKYCRGVLLSTLSCLVWIVLWTSIILKENVYDHISFPMWIVSLIIIQFYLCYCLCKALKDTNRFYTYFFLAGR